MALPTIYLDDNADDDDLILVLQAAGFIVINPRRAGTVGYDDPDHLNYAAKNNFVLLTFDAKFKRWSADHLRQGKQHSGVLIAYKNNNKSKDMKHGEIAKAIHNLLQQCPPLTLVNNVHILNSWRY